MSDTSFDENDRSLGYGRRTYHAACAPGVEITEEQLYAMQRLVVALGLTPNGGKRARPEKLCALLAQHYAEAPGARLAELPRDLRSLVMAMLDDRSTRRVAMTSVLGAVDASTSLERRRAPYDRLRELLPPLVFWLAASHALQGSLKDDYIGSSAGLNDPVETDRRDLIMINKRDEGVWYAKFATYAGWRTYLDDVKREASVDLARDFKADLFSLEGYCSIAKRRLRAELRHPLLMVAVMKALLEAGELMFVESRLGEVQARLDDLRATHKQTASRIDEQLAIQALLKESRKDRDVAIEKSTRLLAAGEATLRDLLDLENIVYRWTAADTTSSSVWPVSHAIKRVQFRTTAELWQTVVESVLSGPAASILLGLDRQLDTV